MRVAYADPPYLGRSKFGAAHHYGDLHPDAADYDTIEAHEALIGRLVDEFPDGWAMSLTSSSLQRILPLCPEDVRIAAWVKGFCSWKPGVNPAYAWEPVIFRGGRKKTPDEPALWKTRDWVEASSVPKRGFVPGVKPDGFCRWLFLILRLHPSDEFVDLFPGSGAVGEAWARFQNQPTLWGAA